MFVYIVLKYDKISLVIKMLILIRFADLTLKGRNMKYFVRQVNKHIKNACKSYVSVFDFRHDQTYLTIEDDAFDDIKKILERIPGIHNFSPIYRMDKNIDEVVSKCAELLQENLSDRHYTFKIETKRSDKKFDLTSLEFTKKVSSLILGKANINLTIDVKKPEKILNIDIRTDGIYAYLNAYQGLGGYPATIAGKGLLMLSGGIDSPVAAFLSMKQGVEVELFHFESTPLTPLESVQKAIDLTKKLAIFHPNQTLKLHLVPFTKMHEAILNHTFDSYHITIMRRMMYRIAEAYAKLKGLEVIINGESIGQVASQTLSSMQVIESVTSLPIIRPVVTYDKKDIIKISQFIDTYDISIRAFNDCCSIYVPKNPVIHPTIRRSLLEEARFDYQPLIEETLENVITIDITPHLDFEIYHHGFGVKDAYINYIEGLET